jgi:hypothetical protein
MTYDVRRMLTWYDLIDVNVDTLHVKRVDYLLFNLVIFISCNIHLYKLYYISF